MATHSSVLALRIPGTGEPGGLPSMGSHRVRHDWSDLAAAAAYNVIYLGIKKKKKKTIDVHNVDKLQKHAKWKKSDTHSKTTYFMVLFICNFRRGRTIEIESISMVAWSWVESGDWRSNRHKTLLLEWCNCYKTGYWLCISINLLNMNLLYIHIPMQWVNFMYINFFLSSWCKRVR